MSLILNGTDGLSDVDGTAATPAIRGTDANTGIFFPAADTIAFSEGGTEAMRIDGSGNVGIGTSSPANKLHIKSNDNTQATGIGSFYSNNGTAALLIGFDRITGTNSTPANASLDLGTGSNPQSMRIEAGGNVLMNKSASSATTNGFEYSASTNNTLYITSDNDVAVLYRKTSNTAFGVLLTRSDVGGTATIVGAGYANGTFAAVSDINKKKNIEPARNYLEDLMKLQVVKYNWKTDEDNAPKELGWIAQEVEEIFPAMVSEIQGNKLLKKEIFLPMMLKAIQELKAELDTVKAELATLKA
jgi:hypothetical protein